MNSDFKVSKTHGKNRRNTDSEGVGKDTRPVPPLPKDYHTSVSEMETNDLLSSTLTDAAVETISRPR